MRTMLIRPFPRRRTQITDLESLIKGRLINDVVLWPSQALWLVGYMAWPNDDTARTNWLDAHRCCADLSAKELSALRLNIIRKHWARVADIVHMHYDLAQGHHQKRRVGARPGTSHSLYAAHAWSS